jgi:lipopolysaccharide export system protein LptC
VFLGLFFALSGLMAWWQLRTAPEAPPSPVARDRAPDYVVLDFTAVETDERGQPSRRLTADELRHYIEEDVSELDQPRMLLFQSDGPPWHGRARQGIVLASGDEIRLIDEVHLERSAGAQTRPLQLETERLTLWRESNYAETDRPVRLTSDQDRLTANGMRLWHVSPMRATFQGRVHILLAPAREGPP